MFDQESSGDIQFRKLMLVVLALSSHTPEENAEKIFYLVDTNSDGFISVEVRGFLHCQLPVTVCKHVVIIQNIDFCFLSRKCHT